MNALYNPLGSYFPDGVAAVKLAWRSCRQCIGAKWTWTAVLKPLNARGCNLGELITSASSAVKHIAELDTRAAKLMRTTPVMEMEEFLLSREETSTGLLLKHVTIPHIFKNINIALGIFEKFYKRNRNLKSVLVRLFINNLWSWGNLWNRFHRKKLQLIQYVMNVVFKMEFQKLITKFLKSCLRNVFLCYISLFWTLLLTFTVNVKVKRFEQLFLGRLVILFPVFGETM